MTSIKQLTLMTWLSLAASLAQAGQVPAITGLPAISGHPVAVKSATSHEAKTARWRANLPAHVSHCQDIDLVVSSVAGFNRPLREYWREDFLTQHRDVVKTWFIARHPPVTQQQIRAGAVPIGKLAIRCRPQLVIANKTVMKQLLAAKQLDGLPTPIIQTRGDLILVKKGNPKHIHNMWDLGRPDVKLVTPDPWRARDDFSSISRTLYHVAQQDPHPPQGWTADRLFNAIFGADAGKDKWQYTDATHHRDEARVVAGGDADAAILMSHQGRRAIQRFPNKVDTIPLAAGSDAPRPLPGSVIRTMYLAKLKGHWTARQQHAQDALWRGLQSMRFVRIVFNHGMVGFSPD